MTEPLKPADAVGLPVLGMIWAQTPDGVIGRDGGMPWHLPEDLAHFRRTTQGHPVIMGRRTWESFPARFRPLPGRTNIVVTRQDPDPDTFEGAVVVGSLQEAIGQAQQSEGSEEIWVIGGGQIYAEAAPLANVAFVTVIDLTVEGDTVAPALGSAWKLSGVSPSAGWDTSENGTRYRVGLWTRDGALGV